MVNWNLFKGTKLARCLRGVSRWGTLCIALIAVVSLTGCIPQPPAACSDNAFCDDGDFCNGSETCDATNAAAGDDGCVAGTAPCDADLCDEENDACAECNDDADCDDATFCNGAETCDTATGLCADGTAPCTADQTCDETNGECDECGTDANCDDGDFCNGAETCADGTCAAGTAPCEANEACDEATDTCQPVCGEDADCDDGFFCNGAETCDTDTGLCVDGTAECGDDGDFCNGTESCDEATDSCSSSGDPCVGTDLPFCNTDTGACEEGTACETDADCDDDGLFCTGTESCVDGFCQSSGDPCVAEDCTGDDVATCNEGLNQCDCPADETFDFTLAVDNLSGDEGDNAFTATLEFNAPTGTVLPTFGNADSANGGDGDDTMSAFFNATANNTISSTLSNIEALTFTDIGTATTTLNGTSWTGVTSVGSSASTNTNALVITNLPALADISLSSTNSGFNVGFQTTASSGTTDSIDLSLSNAGNTTTSGTLTITSGTTNGVETVAATASGSNVLTALTQGTGNTLATLTIGGAGSLQITNALDNSVLTVNASANTGGVTVGVGTGIVAFTGGTGNDTVTYGANYASTDTINGGDGTDALSVTTAVAAPTSSQTNVTNIEALTISDSHTTAPLLSRWGTITTLNLPNGSNGGSATIATGTTVTLGARGTNQDSAGALTLTVSGAAGNDSVTVTCNDSDTTGAVTFSGIELVGLQSNVDLDGSAADGDANVFTGAFSLPDASGTTLTITGTEDVTFSAAVTARVINAAAFAHKVTMTLNTAGNTTTSTVATGGANITGGTNDDVLLGSTSGDSITTGTGNDTVQPGRGIDTVSFGSGRNILDLEDLATAQALAANRVTASGFDANGTAYSATSGTVDAIRFANVAAGNLSDGAVAAEYQAVTTPANITASAGVGIVELAWEFSSGVDLAAGGANELAGTTLLSACGALSGTTACTFTTNANDEDLIIIAYQTSGTTTSAFIYHGNGAGGNTALVASEIALIAVVSGGVTVGGFDVSQFIN